MESEKKDRVRHSLMIEGELHSYVQDLSEKQGRSYNSMLNILLHQGIRRHREFGMDRGATDSEGSEV